MNENVRWTQLTHYDMKQRLSAQFNIHVSSTVIKKLLKKLGFKSRKAQKKETMKKVANYANINGHTSKSFEFW